MEGRPSAFCCLASKFICPCAAAPTDSFAFLCSAGMYECVWAYKCHSAHVEVTPQCPGVGSFLPSHELAVSCGAAGRATRQKTLGEAVPRRGGCSGNPGLLQQACVWVTFWAVAAQGGRMWDWIGKEQLLLIEHPGTGKASSIATLRTERL